MWVRAALLLAFVAISLSQAKDSRMTKSYVDHCAAKPCFGKDSICYNGGSKFKCQCGKGRTGKLCEIAPMPKNPVTIHSYDEPTKSIYAPDGDYNHKFMQLSTKARTFILKRGLNNTIRFKLPGSFYLRSYRGQIYNERAVGARTSFFSESSFYAEESKDYEGYFMFRCYRNKGYVMAHSGEKLVLKKESELDTNALKQTALFNLHDLDAQDSIILYERSSFSGSKIGLIEDDNDLGDHGFDNMMQSFVIFGNSDWELFGDRNYNGRSVIAKPGRYNVGWVKSKFRNTRVSSVRKISIKDGIVFFSKDGFKGQNVPVVDDVTDITKRTSIKEIHSILVVGPSSWELYTEAGFKGTKVVVGPGKFNSFWLKSHSGKKNNVVSARKVEINTPMCSATSGRQKLDGESHKNHNVFVVHKEDGSVWFRFGRSHQQKSWIFKNQPNGVLHKTLLSKTDIAAMKDFHFMDWEVHTDLDLKMSVDNSWHPSKIDVMYLGSKVQETLKFKNAFSDRTDITFTADKSQLACTGKVKKGQVLSNLCGENGLPEYGSSTNSLAITNVFMNPHGLNSYAKNRDFKRNAFTFKGSYYYVYAKLADCASSSGCYKRNSGLSYVLDKVDAKKENRPETFYFGQKNNDVDACEAACKDEPDCVAYTLFEEAQDAFKGGCYGVGKNNVASPVKVAGAHSGKAMKCGSFIPEYMEYDMWTRNTTGCPCKFDTRRTDCACCHEGACQCENRYKYQCTLCGFNDRCGSPFLTTANDEYIFEYTNQQLSQSGHHYKIPDLCVSGCEMEVRGADSEASEVAAYMTDFSGDRVLSCVASGLDKSSQSIVHSEGATTNVAGNRISRINLYSFGGDGQMIELRLKVNKNGCPATTKDERYVGCFMQSAEDRNTTKHTPELVSTHMNRAVCIKHCFNHGFSLAMLKKGTTCMCSDSMPTAGPAFTCDRFCSGAQNQICGGESTYTIFRTHFVENRIRVFAAPNTCSDIKGQETSKINVPATGDECQKMTGADTNGSDIAACELSVCAIKEIAHGGLFLSRPDSCKDRKQGEALVRTIGADCINMGGKPTYGQMEWGMCQLDMCISAVPRTTIFMPVTPQTCPAYARVAEIEVQTTTQQCRDIGGTVRNDDYEDDIIFCQLELCAQDKTPKSNEVYIFPHNNEEFSEGGNNFYSLPEMCITECEFSFKATSDGVSIADITLKNGEMPAGLSCGGHASNMGSVDDLTFAHKATGVKVSGLTISARNHSFIIQNLKFRINPDGCKDEEDMVVFYNKPNFGGRPKVVKEDISDLESINFNNKASSFKIFGNKMWEMFENKDFMGRSAVFSAGNYYDASVLPFGRNDLSSIHITGTLDADMDQTRKEMSNARGIVCFKRSPKSSAVFGLSPNTPAAEDRPRVFFFGQMGNNIDSCERACREEPQCAAFTLFTTSAGGELVPWRGMCYGRSFRDDVQVYQEDVISGFVSSCTEEDTITLYTEMEFIGAHTTIIEDTVNVTFSDGPLSAMVTGKDTWRVLTESEGHIHTYKLAPGEYSDISSTFTGRVFQISKLHPNTQLYKHIHNQVDLAPVASNQIEKTITKVKTKVEGTTTNKTVCNTTNEAEVFFVIDASSSIFHHNYIKVLDFVSKVTESFAIGADKVRVGAIIYSYYSHLDIALGTHSETEELKKDIAALTYYKGLTYTHKALTELREEGLSDANVRDGVAKVAIVITDGESRWPAKTAAQAHLCRDAGIILTAVGIRDYDYDELHNIAGDASRVFNVSDFDQLGDLISAIDKTTCKAVEQGNTVWNITEHVTITVQGDDSNYFLHEDWEFNRKPSALGMESGVIYNSQIFASSALFSHEAYLGRLNRNSGWMTTIGNHTNKHEWIEIDLGKIMPVHGIATQGHGLEISWVTKYKVAISLDGIHFVMFKDLNTTSDLIFIGNSDQSTIKYHCLHRLFGKAIYARVVRFIAIEWHIEIAMRIELYGFRDADDSQLVESLRKDVWTRNVTGCPCYFDPSRKDCACCEDGGCQCPNTDRHQCVQCGYPHNCGTPSLRNPVNNIDGWTSSLSGCRCGFDPLRTDCACCQSYGCQCGGGNKNQCVNCGHPEHCGLKEHIFGPNPYCRPNTCPRKINTIWEGEAPHGINTESNPGIIKEISASSIVQKVMKNIVNIV